MPLRRRIWVVYAQVVAETMGSGYGHTVQYRTIVPSKFGLLELYDTTMRRRWSDSAVVMMPWRNIVRQKDEDTLMMIEQGDAWQLSIDTMTMKRCSIISSSVNLSCHALFARKMVSEINYEAK